jgi:hypothetical protein
VAQEATISRLLAPKDGESAVAHEARKAYLKMGNRRSFVALTDVQGKAKNYTQYYERWSPQFGWVEDARTWDRITGDVAPPLEPALLAEVLEAIADGCARKTCAGIVGVPYARYLNWIQMGLRGSGSVEQQEFARVIRRAEARAKRLLIKDVRASSDWKALWKLAGAISPTEYGPEPDVADLEPDDAETANVEALTTEEMLRRMNEMFRQGR